MREGQTGSRPHEGHPTPRGAPPQAVVELAGVRKTWSRLCLRGMDWWGIGLSSSHFQLEAVERPRQGANAASLLTAASEGPVAAQAQNPVCGAADTLGACQKCRVPGPARPSRACILRNPQGDPGCVLARVSPPSGRHLQAASPPVRPS